jgi:hypothetical protein
MGGKFNGEIIKCLRGKDHLEEVNVDGRKILQWISEK